MDSIIFLTHLMNGTKIQKIYLQRRKVNRLKNRRQGKKKKSFKISLSKTSQIKTHSFLIFLMISHYLLQTIIKNIPQRKFNLSKTLDRL